MLTDDDLWIRATHQFLQAERDTMLRARDRRTAATDATQVPETTSDLAVDPLTSDQYDPDTNLATKHYYELDRHAIDSIIATYATLRPHRDLPRGLPPIAIAHLLVHRHGACRIPELSPNRRVPPPLAIQLPTGVYTTDKDSITNCINRYLPNPSQIATQEVLKELLRIGVDTRLITHDSNLVPVANGILNTSTQELLPYATHDSVFFHKSPHPWQKRNDYNTPSVTVDKKKKYTLPDWIDVIAGHDKATRKLLWHVLASTLRPHRAYYRAITLVGGRSAKRFATLITALTGPGGVTRPPHEVWSAKPLPSLVNHLRRTQLLLTSTPATEAQTAPSEDLLAMMTDTSIFTGRALHVVRLGPGQTLDDEVRNAYAAHTRVIQLADDREYSVAAWEKLINNSPAMKHLLVRLMQLPEQGYTLDRFEQWKYSSSTH